MSVLLVEARRRRIAITERLAKLRRHVDTELGTIQQDLHALETLEREADRQARELAPEFFSRDDG